MAVKRAGLGRGLDGMFTSYLDRSKGEKKETETAKETAQDAQAADQKAEKSKSAKKPAGSVKKVASRKTAGKAETKSRKAENPAKKPADKQEVLETADENIPETPAQTQTDIGTNAEEPLKNAVVMLRIMEVEPNREQPRKEFQEEALTELAESIRQYGVIQPLLVQKRDHYYEIIAGERRWRAAKLAGLKEIPVIIKDYSDQEIVEVSLIENIQREDLNPIEEALAYQRLLEEFHLKQEEVASRVSKNRTTITNSLRLLKLDERVRRMLVENQITGGHARTLLGIEDAQKQYEAAKQVVSDKLSVRDVERLVRGIQKGKEDKKKEKAADTALDLICRDMEEQMKAVLGTKVKVNRKNSRSGRIEIDYYSQEELERIYDLLRSAGK